MLSSNISSDVVWAAMMPRRPAALMATTFCMTGSHCSPPARRLVGRLIASASFRTSAPKAENGFLKPENYFVAPPATKQSNKKWQQFEYDGFYRRSGLAQLRSPAGENRYPPPRMVRITAGLGGSGS